MPDQPEPAGSGGDNQTAEQPRGASTVESLIASLGDDGKALRDHIASLHGQIRSAKSKLTELAPKASEYDKLQESQKSEQQKAADALAKLTAERDAARTELLRYEVLAKFPGLQAGDAAFLTGATAEELEASAQRLLARIQAVAPAEGEQEQQPRRGQPDFGQARNGQGAPADGNAWLRGALKHR